MMALQEQRDLREQNARFARLPDPEPATPILTAARSVPVVGRPVQTAALGGGVVASLRGDIVAMEPIPDFSTPGGQQALAESVARNGGAPPGTALAGFDQSPGEQRVIAGTMEPIPDGSTPEGAAALAESAARQNFSAGPIARPIYSPSPARGGAQAPSFAPSLAVAPQRRTLGLIGSAQASTLPPNLRPVVARQAAGWAVQVGAFSDERQARSAAQSVGGGGRVEVQPVRVGRATLFRARVVGLSQGSAQQACGRVRGACIVLSPDAQG
jgi:cell division septation protein DedD